MTIEQAALTLASLLLAMTMCVHSVRPILAEGAGVMQHPLARFIVPFAWHLTTGIGLVLASILFAWAWMQQHAMTIGLAASATVFTASGIIDAIGSRGKHIGWPPLTLIGLLSLAALM